MTFRGNVIKTLSAAIVEAGSFCLFHHLFELITKMIKVRKRQPAQSVWMTQLILSSFCNSQSLFGQKKKPHHTKTHFLHLF